MAEPPWESSDGVPDVPQERLLAWLNGEWEPGPVDVRREVGASANEPEAEVALDFNNGDLDGASHCVRYTAENEGATRASFAPPNTTTSNVVSLPYWQLEHYVASSDTFIPDLTPFPAATVSDAEPITPLPAHSQGHRRPHSDSPMQSPSPGGHKAKRPRKRKAQASNVKRQHPSTSKTKSRKSDQVEQEFASTSDRRTWSVIETTTLVEDMLGPDGCIGSLLKKKRRSVQENDYKTLAKTEQWKDTWHRSAASLRAKFTQLKQMFSCILQFEGFTGGSGDADSTDTESETDPVQKRIDSARRAGREIGALTSEKYAEWKNNGWYNLFFAQYGHSDAVQRGRIFHSGVLSDREDTFDDETGNPGSESDGSVGSSSESDIQIGNKLTAGVVSGSSNLKTDKHDPLRRRPGVPVAAHKPRPSKTQLTASAITSFLETSAENMKIHVSQQDQRLELARQELQLKAAKDKAEVAKSMLSATGLNPEIKGMAESYIRDYFTLQLDNSK